MNEEQNRQSSDALSEKRKTALLRYLAVLFVVAFLFVAVSLAIQMHNSQATISELNKNSSSALANAEQLQEQNRLLQDEVREQRDTIAAQEDEVASLRLQLAELQQSQTDGQAQADEMNKALTEAETALVGARRAYDALVTALACETQEDNPTYSRAIETVEENKQYLSESALAIYEALLRE